MSAISVVAASLAHVLVVLRHGATTIEVEGSALTMPIATKLEAATAPSVVEYVESDPCHPYIKPDGSWESPDGEIEEAPDPDDEPSWVDPKARRAVDLERRVHARDAFAIDLGAGEHVVYVLGAARYEVEGAQNVALPTNVVVSAPGTLFPQVQRAVPGAIVTEAVRVAAAVLDSVELATLGNDRLGATFLVITRLHLRLASARRLALHPVKGLSGGFGDPDSHGAFEEAVRRSGSRFRSRQAMFRTWTGEIACERPERGAWLDKDPVPVPIDREAVLVTPLPPIEPMRSSTAKLPTVRARGCGCASTDEPDLAFALVAAILVRARRHRRCSTSRRCAPQPSS